MRSLPLLLALLLLSPASFAGALKGIPAPQLRAAVAAHLSAFDLNGSPAAMAGVLSSRITAAGATPADKAAAALLVEAVRGPEGLQAVKALIEPSRMAGLAGQLDLLSARMQAEGGAEAFQGLVWRLNEFFGEDGQGPAVQASAVYAGGAGAASQLPAAWRLKKIEFQVAVGEKPAAEKLPLSTLMSALEDDDREFLDRFRPTNATHPKEQVVRLSDASGRVRVVSVAEEAAGRRTIWADFSKNERHPLLDKLKEKFTFAPFVSTGGDEQTVSYEEPHIDEDTAQLTLYGVKLSKDGALSTEETHVYLGERLLVTAHPSPRASVETALHLLTETGRFKTAPELMVFLLADNISRYGAVVESLTNDFARLSEKLAAPGVDKTIMADSVAAGRKIDEAYKTVIKQKQVLRALLRINEFHQSPLVPAAEIEQQIQTLNHQLDVLDHYQDRKNGLVDIYRAKISNQQDTAMKHLAAFTAMMIPPTVAGALYGMNVALPGASAPHVFWLIVGVVLASMASIFLTLKKMRWL